MHGDCALFYYLIFKFGEHWAAGLFHLDCFPVFLACIIQTSVIIGIMQNNYNSTIQRKYWLKYNQPGLLML